MERIDVRRLLLAGASGAIIGTLGGLIGLGGAEFRLPVLLGPFKFRALEAVILNKAMSLIVVAAALPFRAVAVPVSAVLGSWGAVLNLLAGSLIGAWLGAGWATRVSSRTLYRTIAVMLVFVGLVLLLGHGGQPSTPPLAGPALVAAGIAAGLGIGVVAAVMGVAGGELLIPTFVLLFGADIKLAGSLSLAVSLPTMLVGFARYSRDNSFGVLGRNKAFALVMAAGSIAGAFLGSRLVSLAPSHVLVPLLAIILFISAWKVWKHE